MKLLAVETSTDACSVALYNEGVVQEHFEMAPRKHTQIILPMIDRLLADVQLKPQQLDALAFGRGPGSFTGVRIAAGIVQGIAFAADLPIVPVSTLMAMAHYYFKTGKSRCAYVAMDARMGEIFWGVYQQNQQGLTELLDSEIVTLAENINRPKQPQQGTGIGSAWGLYQQPLSQCLGTLLSGIEVQHLPRASAVADLAVLAVANKQTVVAEHAIPVYIRDNVAKKQTQKSI